MLKFFSSHASNRKPSLGFTLIELIVVFSVLAILSMLGIAAFVSYTNTQKLQTATLTVKTLLAEARSKSLSQTNTCTNGTIFQGYAAQLCISGAACAPGNDYELDSICSGVLTTVDGTGGKFPPGVKIDSATSPTSYRFIPITGGVMQAGTIVLDETDNNTQAKITVSSTGVIQ